MKEELPGFVLAELYSNVIVIAEDKSALPVVEKPKAEKLKKFLGDFKKKILILINDEENLFINDNNLQFLTGILKACNLNLGDIALINKYQNPINYTEIKKEMKPAYLILFGVTAMDIELPFIMPDYKVQLYDNCSLLTAPALKFLNGSSAEIKANKTRLWNALQKMFDLV